MKKKDKKIEEKKPDSFLLKIIKSPFRLGKKARERRERKVINRKRESMSANYEKFEVIKSHSGDFDKWVKELMESESKIGLVLGARGSGKTAFALKLLENIYSTNKKKCYAIGFKNDDMPNWIEVVENVEEIKNNSFVLIDEGGILFSSRKSMTKPNKLLSDLILISRHKNLSILFITQNSSNLDINVIRQADFLALKPTSLLQKDFERKRIRDIYHELENDFKKHGDEKGLTHIYADRFRGFISNPLPSFWNVRISKSFS